MASTLTNETAASAPDPLLVLFARGVIARLGTWHALRLAIDQSWGGPESTQKQTWMASVIVDEFDPSQSLETPDAPYVEEMLLQIMDDEFDVILEDGSSEAVARDIVSLWEMREAEPRMKAAVELWEEQVNKARGKKVPHQEVVDSNAEVDGSGSEWEDDDEAESDGDEVPPLLQPRTQKSREEPEVDDEGFTRVTSKRKSHS
ncbi:uncharacterized protein FOMMEDRAFT_125191 [Fomitiporia mediterranea MF3/22]|uniref:uncharacterized protein n=1 Tax=Fomitiporia mediterranea (strain MF3/22) TaxID=694068 RepID=UPI0004408ACB|nr:uncharacterized protein FOMMEDRAFT_125191 [Fomitiporia mediterranea MF3/22]EJD00778.1 hypothetical protein FOMMEDRAFT_125191 [Fomitiporia mediterranea MF3/22]